METPTTSAAATPTDLSDMSTASDISSITSSGPPPQPRHSMYADLLSSPRSPRFFVRSRTRSASAVVALPLLQVNAGIHGRMGLSTSTTLSIAPDTLSYGRYEIPLEEIEQAAYDEITSTVVLKFSFRSKPKHLVLESSASCRAVCQLLEQLLDRIDNPANGAQEATSRTLDMSSNGCSNSDGVYGLKPPPHVATSSPELSYGELDLSKGVPWGGPSGGGSPTPTSTPPLPDPPGWLLTLLERANVRDPGRMVYTRVRTGWCCRKYTLEAILFGVMMPLATAGYWLSDASGLGAETGRYKLDEKGRNRWLAAECQVSWLNVVPRQFYHHGKFADAKDVAYQDGRVWRLEPAYNASVTLKGSSVYGAAYAARSSWPSTWSVALQTTPTVSQRPHCDGQVLQTLLEVRRDCSALRSWIPTKYLQLNTTGAQECFVDRRDRTLVYLDIDEPLSYYLDLLLICIMISIAAVFAMYISCQHSQTLVRTIRGGRNGAALDERRRPSATEASIIDNSSNGTLPAAARSSCRNGSTLTPENIKDVYRHVVRGFHEMV